MHSSGRRQRRTAASGEPLRRWRSASRKGSGQQSGLRLRSRASSERETPGQQLWMSFGTAHGPAWPPSWPRSSWQSASVILRASVRPGSCADLVDSDVDAADGPGSVTNDGGRPEICRTGHGCRVLDGAEGLARHVLSMAVLAGLPPVPRLPGARGPRPSCRSRADGTSSCGTRSRSDVSSLVP